MAGTGGYQRPTNPAPVSGPGSMSRRTDGGPAQPIREMTGGEYGDSSELRAIQGAAPMAASGVQTQGQSLPVSPSAPAPTPLGAPTERPDEPVTEGNAFGPGSGPDALSGGLGAGGTSNDPALLRGYLPSLIRLANQPDVPEGFVRFVRHLRTVAGQ